MTGSEIPPAAETAEAAASSPRRIDLLTASCSIALGLIAALVVAATAASFAESYRALYEWAGRHGIPPGGAWDAIWPLQVDVFIATGELLLFVALARSWRLRDRAGAWAVTLGGLAASVAGNVGHVTASADRLTAAVPPLAAAASLALGLGALKRVVNPPASTGIPLDALTARALAQFADSLHAGELPGVRLLRRELHVGQRRAQRVRGQLARITSNGWRP